MPTTVLIIQKWMWIGSSQSWFTTEKCQPSASGMAGLSSNPGASSTGSPRTTFQKNFGRTTGLDLEFQVRLKYINIFEMKQESISRTTLKVTQNFLLHI